jgi:hypothetical protein
LKAAIGLAETAGQVGDNPQGEDSGVLFFERIDSRELIEEDQK